MSNPQDELNVAIAEVHKAIAKACEIADKYGLDFRLLDERYVGSNGGKRLTVDDYYDGTYYYEMDEDDPRYDPAELYAGWQNSSTFC